jgi:hypothetical protein
LSSSNTTPGLLPAADLEAISTLVTMATTDSYVESFYQKDDGLWRVVLRDPYHFKSVAHSALDSASPAFLLAQCTREKLDLAVH